MKVLFIACLWLLPGVASSDMTRALECRATLVGSTAPATRAAIPADDRSAAGSAGECSNEAPLAGGPAAEGTILRAVSPEGFDPNQTLPLPNAAWLFGSALIGFVAWSRRRAN